MPSSEPPEDPPSGEEGSLPPEENPSAEEEEAKSPTSYVDIDSPSPDAAMWNPDDFPAEAVEIQDSGLLELPMSQRQSMVKPLFSDFDHEIEHFARARCPRRLSIYAYPRRALR